MYIIQNKIDPELCWHNDFGWIDQDGAELFENMDYNLPIGGEWVEV